LTEELLNKLTDFVKEHLPYRDSNLIKQYIEQHENYHTIDYAVDEKGDIVGVCRWNITQGGTTAHLLDFAVRKDFRSKGVGRDLLKRGLHRFNRVKYLIYERGKKYPNRKQKMIPVEQILKRRVI